jgi:hypothetical protein
MIEPGGCVSVPGLRFIEENDHRVDASKGLGSVLCGSAISPHFLGAGTSSRSRCHLKPSVILTLFCQLFRHLPSVLIW